MNKPDLTKPTRQSTRGLLLIFLFSAQKFIRVFWPALLVLVFQNKWIQNQMVVIIILVVFLGLLIVHTILYYLNFFFYIEGNEFVLKTGYLRKQTLTVPIERIQSVNTKQNIIQQLLDVISLEIDTAGTAGKELKIHALDKYYADELQKQLRAVKSKSPIEEDPVAGDVEEEKEELLLQLTPADLLKIGISQNHIRAALVILAFGMQLFQQIQDLFEEQANQYSSRLVEFLSQSNWALVSFLVIFFLVIAIFFSLLRTVIKYFDFKLLKKEHSYRIEAGLLNKRNVIVPHYKVQQLNWETGPLKRIFGIYHLVFKQAVSGQNRRQQQQLVDAPGCLATHLERLKTDLFGEDILSGLPKIRTNSYYFRRLWIFYGWLPFIAAVPFLYEQWLFWMGSVVWVMGAAGYSYLMLKKSYFKVNNHQIRISKGAVSQRWQQMELFKIQSVEFRQSFFQKRKSLASLRLMNASGSVSIPFIDEKIAKQLYDYLLYHTEISEERWM
ncbi:MAG TPA: PH domain-containing protein [Prolixibacteraceae bacterium]|nr:PH domain-containing protein [Prolixibacteraceae bacterium]